MSTQNLPRSDAKWSFRPFSPPLAQTASTDGRVSLDSDRSTSNSSPPVALNGSTNGVTHSEDDTLDPIQRLQQELRREKDEKEKLSAQYHNLLAKLTTMRTSLGNKLKQDAEELDRREQQVNELSARNNDLSSTVETLTAELIASHEESERTARDLDSMRSRVLNDNAQESLLRERELREATGELERCRIERDEWERLAMQEKVIADEAKLNADTLGREMELEREARERESIELEEARIRSDNLQSVLEDFQAAKEHELNQAVRDFKDQLDEVTLSLAEYKRRALDAELKLEENSGSASRIEELEKETKEKNLLIGKLRHEAVILNEHLMEALRRLRRNSSDTNVDRRLVTNVLLSFLATPRADPKRFEMLSLLSTVLSWSDAEREKAGLQRTTLQPSGTTSFWGRPSNVGSPTKSPGSDLEKTDETESFSRLWVEFLLTEANQGESPTRPRSNNSVPSSPTRSPYGQLSSPSAAKGTRRLASYTSAAMASSPNLALAPPPSRKGKEKEVVS